MRDDFNLDRGFLSDCEFQDKHTCNAWVATAIVGSAVVGGVSTMIASNKAANAQTNAADKAADISRQQYAQTREDLAPYRDMGSRAGTELESRLPFLTSAIELTPEWLENTPGYKFTQTQGLKAVSNSAAKRGLGVSGAALKGAAAFATGLADSTYKTQFDVENTNRTNAYNRLMGLVTVGQNAAAQTGVLGEKAAYNQGQAMIGAGNAQAAGYNAAGAAVTRAADNVGGYFAYKGLYGDAGMPTRDAAVPIGTTG